jgi:S-DNA-T family DNA segregation ATPase FtsK/SpoIIIE
VSARAFGTRAFRCALTLAVPACVLIVPPWMLIEGNPGALLAWPAAYGYLSWLGWTHREDEPVPSVTMLPPDEEKTKLFSRNRAESGLKPTPQESAIIDRIHGWEANAAERKLTEVIPGAPIIDESGILIPVTFAGTWTPGRLDANADQVRALLAVPDEVRTEIKPGGTADRSLIRVRTRVRDLDLTWNPGRKGLGLDADTAEGVHINTDDRILVAGTSGSGKSVALRVIMADVLTEPNAALVILDLKKVEGALWRHTARVETEPEGIQSVIDDLIVEMKEREDIMETHGVDLWVATPERPKIVVVVDEGAELMAEVPDSVGGLRSLARRARASRILLVWGTQKPTMTGNGPGLDSQISGQLTSRVCLAVAGAKETRVVFGEEATGNGWHAEDLEMGGWALVQVQGEKRTPNPMRIWFMTKEDVKALQPRSPWRRAKALSPVTGKDALVIALELSEGMQGVSTARLGVALGVADTEVHVRMRVHGVDVEPNAFAMGNGEKARGYRRDKLEAAFNRRNDR